jgi:hypothetical protein
VSIPCPILRVGFIVPTAIASMVQFSQSPQDLIAALDLGNELTFQLPDPEDEAIPDHEFEQQLDTAWQVSL